MAIKEDIIEEPPVEIKGRFIPFVGKMPNTTLVFQKASSAIKTAIPAARSFSKELFALYAICIERKNKTRKAMQIRKKPIKPISSAITDRIKSL